MFLVIVGLLIRIIMLLFSLSYDNLSGLFFNYNWFDFWLELFSFSLRLFYSAIENSDVIIVFLYSTFVFQYDISEIILQVFIIFLFTLQLFLYTLNQSQLVLYLVFQRNDFILESKLLSFVFLWRINRYL